MQRFVTPFYVQVLTCHERVKEARLAKERDAGLVFCSPLVWRCDTGVASPGGRLVAVGHGPSIVVCWTFETGRIAATPYRSESSQAVSWKGVGPA